MPNRPIPLALAALSLALGLAPVPARATDAPGAPVRLEVGQIAGARFEIAVPAVEWNHRLLLIAHGYRPESAPLVPDLRPGRASNRALLDEGWMVATTSYRRNGVVVGDAIADLDALRTYIANAYGTPERVILEGDSLGGLVVTIMAERDKGAYDGAVAFDATLYVKDNKSLVGLSLLPTIPLLFVATEREAKQSKGYLTALVSRPDPIVPPALFLIRREGHDNINQAEHLAALRALIAWIDHGPESLPRPKDQAPYYDATVEADPGPSSAVPHAGGRGFDTRVAEVDPVYGNVLLEAQAGDFAGGAIPPMTFCEVRIRGTAYRTLYGRTYSDVKDGQWVAFPDADGRTVLSKVLGDAAGTAGIRVGDPVSLEPVAPGGAPLR
jgi:pimeloyl-ACP methyl ester carboxylesterase